MTIQDTIEQRGIHEVLHFTTNKGITGILATGFLKARKLLSEDYYLEHIYQYNCKDRSRDMAWEGYVNLSITSVNRQLLGISSGKWHANEDGWWCILSFTPDICSHPGVYFTTTNNMYSNGVKRARGVEGLNAMFASQITQWPGRILCRPSEIPDNQPTCEQAEVLYPEQISLKYLQKIYVMNNDIAVNLESIKIIFSEWQNVPCEINVNLF